VLDTDLDGEPLHLLVCEVGPGERSHPPHRQGGIEGFSMLDGEGTSAGMSDLHIELV
jgi:hypothetical protein